MYHRVSMLGDTVIISITVKLKIVAYGFKYMDYFRNLMLFSGSGMVLFYISILWRHLWIIGGNNSAEIQARSNWDCTGVSKGEYYTVTGVK